jgi:hypothetical protein
MIPVAVMPPLSPPMLTHSRSLSPVIIGQTRVNSPAIGYTQQIGSNQNIVRSSTIPISSRTLQTHNQGIVQPYVQSSVQTHNQGFVQPYIQSSVQPVMKHQSVMMQPQQQVVQTGYDMMHTDRMLMQKQQQQQFVQTQIAQGMAMMAYQRNCC